MTELRNPATHAIAVSLMAHYRMLLLFVEKGLITQQEAASTLVQIANDARSGTEDAGPIGATLGEMVAGRYEQAAAWMLGRKTET